LKKEIIMSYCKICGKKIFWGQEICSDCINEPERERSYGESSDDSEGEEQRISYDDDYSVLF